MDSGLPCVIRIPLSLHAHVALSRYADVCITALVRASPHRAVCNIHAFSLRAASLAFRCRYMLMSRCRAMCVFALLRSCVQARTAHYATHTLFYERCHSHSAVATCSCRAVALCGCLHYCTCACKPAPRSMQHPRTAHRNASVLQRIHKCRNQLFLS